MKKRHLQLSILAGVSALTYALVFTLRFPLITYYAAIPPIDYTKLTNYAPGGVMAYLAGIVLLFVVYLWAIRLTAPPTQADDSAAPDLGSFIFTSSTVLAAISVFAYPLTAIDLFIYAIRTRGWALYGLNPLATAPEQLPAADPWLGLAGEWVDAASPYGPVWEWLSWGAFHLSGGDFLPHLLALKIVAMLAYLGCVWFVYNILRQCRPDWAVAGTLAFAWNPLVLLESVQNGHNDIVMIFFLLAAVWVFGTAQVDFEQPPAPFEWRLLLTCLLLALSILVKFITIIIVPFFLIGLAGRRSGRLRRLGVMVGYGFLIAVLVVWPMFYFWPGLDNWAVLQAGSQAGRSLLALLILGLKGQLGVNPAFDVARYLVTGVFALIYLYFLGQMLSRMGYFRPVSRSAGDSLPGPTAAGSIIRPSFFTLFWYVLLMAPVFHAWYLLWFLPLAMLLVPDRRPFSGAVVFTMTALLIIPYFETIRVWYPYLLQNQLIGHLIGVPLLIVPPALALFWPISPSSHSEV